MNHEVFDLFDGYQIEYRKSIQGIESKWDNYVGSDFFISSRYLGVLEMFPPKNMRFRYVCLLKEGKAIGVLYYQVIHISLSNSLQGSSAIKRSLAAPFQADLLVNGNTLVTGAYGHYFQDDLGADLVFRIVDKASDIVAKELKKDGIKIRAHLKKDYPIVTIPSDLSKSKYVAFHVQPNMEFHLKPEWETIEDYKSALKSKYRVRMKRAKKKASAIFKKELDVDDLITHQEVMYNQYMQTVDGAGFNLFYLHKEYNIGLKKKLGEDFKVVGYFKNENQHELLGYYTLIKNEQNLDAHFLGYEHSENSKYQTYLNFLFDMIEYGIDASCQSINLSRTAMEIKSSVGATDVPLKIFMKYNGILNRLLPKALDYFVPEDKWLPRNPFK